MEWTRWKHQCSSDMPKCRLIDSNLILCKLGPDIETRIRSYLPTSAHRDYLLTCKRTSNRLSALSMYTLLHSILHSKIPQETSLESLHGIATILKDFLFIATQIPMDYWERVCFETLSYIQRRKLLLICKKNTLLNAGPVMQNLITYQD